MPIPIPLSAQTQAVARPVVALDCARAEARLPGVCRALSDALRMVAPGAVQRRMDDLSKAPARAQDLAVALVVMDARLRLDWRRGRQPLARGASVAIGPDTPGLALMRRLLSHPTGPFP